MGSIKAKSLITKYRMQPLIETLRYSCRTLSTCCSISTLSPIRRLIYAAVAFADSKESMS